MKSTKKNLSLSRSVCLPLLLLVVCACLVVALRWLTIDVHRAFIPGLPSPRTYFAVYNMKYEDDKDTEKLKDLVRGGISAVLVKKPEERREVEERLFLLGQGRLDEAGISPALAETIRSLPDQRAKAVLGTLSSVGLALAGSRVYGDSLHGITEDALWNSLAHHGLSPSEGNVAVQVMGEVMTPLVKEDDKMTARLRDIAAEAVTSVPREIEAGDVLVPSGVTITDEMAHILERQGYPRGNFPLRSLLVVMFMTPPVFIWSRKNSIVGWDSRRTAYLAFLFLVALFFGYLGALFNMVSMGLLPMAAIACVTMPLRRARNALMGATAMLALVFGGSDPVVVAETLSTGIVAVALCDLLFRRIDSRSRLWLGMVNLGIILGVVSLLVRWFFCDSLGCATVFRVLVGSLLSGTVTMLVLPMVEVFFDILSPLRLLELCQADHPLQKRLQMEAPGTYHHSQMVAILAEGAAEDLGLNSKLVKAGSFFHDIGKLKRPHFFVENQMGGKNAHDDVSPVMSALIIISHVKDGLALAEEHRLPEGITHFISEHHGTTFLGYFYKKAQKEGLNPSKSQFVYPGPKPRTRETGVVMMADSVEAAVRSERGNIKSVLDLQQIVDAVVASKISAGQLDDTGFTLKDIASAKASMVKNLQSMYHGRNIAPIPEDKPKDKAANKSAEAGKDEKPQ